MYPVPFAALHVERDIVVASFVATGGAWLLASALLNGRSGRWNPAQVRGLYFAGMGFLASAAAARWLEGYGPRGAAVSLVGTLFAMRGMFILVRERAARGRASRDGDSRTRE